MIPTPDLSHLTKDDFEHVYEPAEDTFILLDALEQDAEELRNLKPSFCLEIGSGSGCVSAFIGTILGSSASMFLCTDINPLACRATLKTGTRNKIPLEPVQCSLTAPLLPRLSHSVDVLLFNPPYVPTFREEAEDAQGHRGIQGAWAGGAAGMEVTQHLLDIVQELLSETGRFYLVAVKQNDVPAIRRKMLEVYNLPSEIVIQRQAGREHLFVVKFFRQHITIMK
ncbi:hypothetical protein JAAARDRAFT_352675 [Jaapia argillacea MUCL 33604]|uniref:Methyltransferase small domain-containing protein n=1 Tax=Jaapia argillacea MUCL 33604 TaxID=933084 RepID=A0A067PJ88_9AGAM|nr:hypothetical protein JAAARDRAFT_352675 [Jaapia argillacea MUCL 33604]